MAGPRNLTDVAIDCAIHGMPDPQNGWRNHIPGEDLGAMPNGGSGQITLQALVASLWYDGSKAIKTLENYEQVCQTRFMLSEPWSKIYGRAIVNCWAAVVLIARKKGYADLASRFAGLIDTWSATCALMVSDGLIMAAGCRSWGWKLGVGGFHEMWAKACGSAIIPPPGSKKYGIPGVDDDWGWLSRCEYLAKDIYRKSASGWDGKDPMWILDNAPRWAARTTMELIGWKDGSRAWIMGEDQEKLVDEDENSNTPGVLFAGMINHKPVELPPFPANGITHLRQTAVVADIDGSPEKGWILLHSHLGDKSKYGKFLVSSVAPYKPDEVIFWVRIPSGSLSWVFVEATPIVPMRTPIVPPKEPVTKKRGWLSRLFEKLFGS